MVAPGLGPPLPWASSDLQNLTLDALPYVSLGSNGEERGDLLSQGSLGWPSWANESHRSLLLWLPARLPGEGRWREKGGGSSEVHRYTVSLSWSKNPASLIGSLF